MIRLCLLTMLTLAATPALPDILPGRYDADAVNDMVCTPYSNGAVDVSADELRFYESRCALANPEEVEGLGGAVLYDGQCAGEGQEWDQRILLMPGIEEDMLVMVLPGYAGTYRRCPD